MFWSMAPLVVVCIVLAGVLGMCSFAPNGPGEGTPPPYDAPAALQADADQRRVRLLVVAAGELGERDQVAREPAAGQLPRLGEGDDDRIEELRAEHAELTERLAAEAAELTAVRTRAAERFSEAVTEELTALAMPHARVVVTVTPTDDYGPHGVDEVEVRLAPHPGSRPLPLHKGASGGELSRVMLAIEVVLAGTSPVPTFVFDEVDAGVGGKAAVEVGRRLAALARASQVLVVTHLPQVAAFADRHVVVAKSSDGTVTTSGLEVLDDEGLGALPVVTQVDHRLLGAAMARVHWELVVLRNWQRDAVFLTSQVLGPWFDLLLPPPPFDAARQSDLVRVLEAIAQVNAELGTTTALITHNAAIREMAHRVLLFGGGRITATEVNATRKPPSEITW